MGIHKLMSLIQEKAKSAIKSINLDALTGRVIACDASTAMYQFMVTTFAPRDGFKIEAFKDPEGNPTSHLIGLFNRTIQFLSHGIKPVWVFDGKPPEMKKEELRRRKELKAKAEEMKEKAEEEGKLDEAKMMASRSVKITPKMSEEAKQLIRLMGLPVVEASSEAEAQCSVLVKAGKAYATATEDMDALTFGSTRLIRGFNSKKDPMCEIDLSVVLKEFQMSMDEFIDLCILCGCDYTPHIEGIGPIRAFKLIQSLRTMEKVLDTLDEEISKSTKEKKYRLPAGFDYATARKLFKEPDVQDPGSVELKWGKPDAEALKKFLIEEKGFDPTRVESGLAKITKAQSQGTQSRLDSFFTGHKTVSSKAKEVPTVKKEKPKSGRKRV
eukprot:TRINITY_DN1103_c0_g1_i1.p1 TRINITY_DN1103_c0_g1~~TRINITY_DN1103_c0_g1_i1.p1  ORF type:complete len:383 (+),score=133.59 TRINITY_DN1103_c0_g1_i1:125-1273(+)